MAMHMPRAARSRGWCFTLNNPDGDHLDVYDKIECIYLVVGDEGHEDGKTPHHQGYVYFATLKSLQQVKTMLPGNPHLEAARGTPKQNTDYCSKEAILVVKGEMPVQGKRKDIDKVKEIVADGGNMSDIIGVAGGLQTIKVGEVLLKYLERERDFAPQVYWFWGPTGTNKTRTAREMAPESWMTAKSLRWWDGYDAHEDVIFDDFRGDFCTFHELLRVLDRYPYRIENKGGSRQLLAKRIFITCPYHPRDVYKSVEDKGQLIRRITEIRHFPRAAENVITGV